MLLDQINSMDDWIQALIQDYGEDVINFYLSNVCDDPEKFYFFYQGTQDYQPDDHLNFIYDPNTKSLFQNFDLS